MKKKTKGTITSIVGAMFMATGVAMTIANYFVESYSFDISDIGFVMTFGYIFLTAKDDLIQWLLLRRGRDDKE